MERFRGGILVAMVMLCSMGGCGEKHGISGARLETPPVAPLAEAGEDAGIAARAHPAMDAGGASNAGGRGQDPPRAATWPFRPTTLRLHPLSHALRRDDRVSVIEARVEFFDRFRHTTKGLGVMHFELHSADGAGPRLVSWEIDVSDVDANMRHYDDVTRTYLFRLGLDGIDDPPPAARLTVTVVLPDQRLTGSLIIALR